jgi:hypothetical protein
MSVLTIEKSQRVTTSTINLNRTEISDSSMVLILVTRGFLGDRGFYKGAVRHERWSIG